MLRTDRFVSRLPRFFPTNALDSKQEFRLQVLAVAALFLACKVEEEARRLGKILEAMFQCRYKANTRALELLSRKVSTPCYENTDIQALKSEVSIS